MKSFLRLLAEDMMYKYGTDFENLTVIFPNKRAGLFLAEEISRLIRRPIWMPQIVTLPEFIEKQTGLHYADSLTLTIKLYKSYTKTSGSGEKFEDFYFWGSMLLDDFDDIDKYLVDAKDLFSNLVALKELDGGLSYLNPEQTEAIRKFWSSFNPDKYSEEQKDFLNVWNHLYATYLDYKDHLLREQLCYEGMGERLFCEHIGDYPQPRHILFVGFNALNKCEKQIFSYYRDLNQASFYWDYDIYYTANDNHEAGHYMRENLKNFPNALGLEHFNNFRYTKKEIDYIAVPSLVGQAKLIPALTAKLADMDHHNTAVVLCDEPLLIPVMHSIPDHIRKINITMGYPASNTSVASLITLLCDLNQYAKREETETYYYYKPVIALLNHKLIKDLCPDDIHKITNFIHQKNIVYIAGKSLHFHELTRIIFNTEEESIPDYLLKILNLLTRFHKGEKYDPIEREFIFAIYTQIQSLQNTFLYEGIEPENKLYMQIISKVISKITVPFSGEPLEGLQLMGLLETRMLDFKNLIILSANEGTLPKTTYPSSFIPYNLRVGFRLPTPEHLDALSAYYFYRLLQRAEHIQILYTNGMKGVNSGEMSRFLYQIKYESGLTIHEKNFQNQISAQTHRSIEMEKNENILQLLEMYTRSKEKTLSPSALNTYLECQMKFYFKYIARIQEKEEMAEELDHRLLGNIFHECSQSLYATIAGGNITCEIIDKLLQDEALIHKHIHQSYLHFYDVKITQLMDSGSNELILNIIKKYLREMLSYDRRFCPFQMIAMETHFHVPVPISIGGMSKTVYIGGTIDRVDRTREGIRIIDYKTGADTTSMKNIPSVFDVLSPTRNKAAFQTMLYCLMFDHTNPTELPLIPGIYSTKLLFGKDYDYHLKCDKDHIYNFRQHKEEYLDNLKNMLQALYSPAHKFTQTEAEKKCRTCKYACICRK